MLVQELLTEHVLNPTDYELMYRLAEEYDRLENGAQSVTFYMRAAERTTDDLLSYKCLLRTAAIIHRQGMRGFTARGFLARAIALLPTRPEAYYFMAKEWDIMRWNNGLRDMHMFYRLAALYANDEDIGVNYPGSFITHIDYALAMWDEGMLNEATDLLFELMYITKPRNAKEASYLNRAMTKTRDPLKNPYKKKHLDMYKFPFPGIENIEENYSQQFQDMFILSMLRGKKNGTYLELGSSLPFLHNNTALLETQYDWHGISVEMNEEFCMMHSLERKGTIIHSDAMQIDYGELLKKHMMPRVIDYLQIDVDYVDLDLLYKMPFDDYKFRIVTFEHDAYQSDGSIREKQREHLLKHGYQLFVPNVEIAPGKPFEDWWIHPDYVDINKDMITNKPNNFVWDYFMKGEVDG